MKSSFCPKCSQIPFLDIQTENIFIKCKCGFLNILSVKDYLKKVSGIKPNRNSIIPNTIKKQLMDAEEHLSQYFSSIKNQTINEYLSKINEYLLKINEIESAYEKSYTMNSNILKLIKIMIDNCNDYNSTMYINVNNHSKFNIYKYNSTNTDLLDYYNEYKILFPLIINIDSISAVKKISEHKDKVTNLLLLNDGRIASTSLDHTIKIFHLSNYTYHCDITIEEHIHYVSALCQLEDGRLVSASWDKSIRFYSIGQNDYTNENFIKNAHNESINVLLPLSDNRIVSCSPNCEIKIWSTTIPYTVVPIQEIKLNSCVLYSILYIKEKNELVAALYQSLQVLDMSNYGHKFTIDGVKCVSAKGMCQLDSDRFIVGGYGVIYLVNNYKKEKEIDCCDIENVYCFMKMRNSRIILCGCDKGKMCMLDRMKNDIEVKQSEHKGNIKDLVSISNFCFASASASADIILWKY